ncbi:30S ribosomal protein S9 [Candidatus Micrarchaeota archaeon CG08_land_8_20_14_0_20_59_11]|nr:MAG: 30S ribosomal protein S9 [Candidatus Micrarchaeota archaeon CG08_land_8_20_14_0_20_59_11]
MAEKVAKKKKTKIAMARGKRKEAIARATVREGKGLVRINDISIDALQSPFIRQIITEPLRFIDAAQSAKIDVRVTVRGGGVMGQAQAARTAIARAVAAHFGDDLRKRMIEYDRSLIVEDPRRVEPKKFKGPKARARFTKSYR